MNDTSWFEIVWKFSEETGCLVAMNPKNKGKRKRNKEIAYFLRSKAGFETLPMAETHQQIRVFQLTLKALEKKVQKELVPRSRVQYSRSFRAFGGKGHVGGVGARLVCPSSELLQEVQKTILLLPQKKACRGAFPQ